VSDTALGSGSSTPSDPGFAEPVHAGGDGEAGVAPALGWPRAILSGIAIVLVGFVGAIYGPKLLLDALQSQSVQTRSLIVVAVSVTFVIVLARLLRLLQAKGLI